MDLKALGIDTAIIAGIIAITQAVKALDSENRLKRFYILVPTILGFLAALFITTPPTWQAVGRNALVYIGAATYFYSAGSKMLFPGDK